MIHFVYRLINCLSFYRAVKVCRGCALQRTNWWFSVPINIPFITSSSSCCANSHTTHTQAHAGRDDIVVVIHIKAHPIQLLPFQPAATEDKQLERFMGKHFTIYIMAVDQWLQFFSHLMFKETRDSCMIRVSGFDVKMKCSCNTLSLTVTYVRKSLPSPCFTLLFHDF